MKKSSSHERGLIWTINPPSARELRKTGYKVLQFREFRSQYIEPARAVTSERVSLDNAAAPLLRLLDENPRLAVLEVPAATVGDLRNIYSFLVEPAFRRDIDLLLGVDRKIEALDPASMVASDLGYPWTFERLKFIAERYHRKERTDGLPPLTPIEDQLLTAMRSAGLTPQVQYGISRFRVDFAFPAGRLAVEADGRAWHDAERDAARDAYLEELGWKTIRFSGSQIYRDADGVVAGVLAALEERESIVTFSDLPAEPWRRGWWRRILHWLRGGQHRTDPLSAPDLQRVERPLAEWKGHLDDDQRNAIDSHEGVVQVIAPAGSGKTMTMIARVQELLSRGVPANRILCTTFNRASREELEDRLRQLGIPGVTAKSFHALGRMILADEKHLRADTGTISYPQWRRLAMLAKNAVGDAGVWLDAPVASEAVSNLKLGRMWTPNRALREATKGNKPVELTSAKIYELYEDHLESSGRNDFDDLIIGAVRLLQLDHDIRRRWQGRWDTVLVDEYQDIEPAQELLVQLVAAPQDSLFAVGDEDQCIYSWRRATVTRIVMLDTVYPGLERFLLRTSYRCPSLVTAAAKRLIEHNRTRFRKEILSDPSATDHGTIEIVESDSLSGSAEEVAKRLSQVADPSEVVVLARTTRLLREVVQACVLAGVSVKAPQKALGVSDAERTLLAYIRLLASPSKASEQDVRHSFWVPNRYLPDGAETRIAQKLRSGLGFGAAARSLLVAEDQGWRIEKIHEWGDLLDRLKTEARASDVIRVLRTQGGLDHHYASVEQMSPSDQTETEALDDIEKASGTRQLTALVTDLEQRAQGLVNASNENGIELATIHGAKGREWNTVILFGANRDQLPHYRSVSGVETNEELVEALEDERRLAYVAMTRTKSSLVVTTTEGEASPFLSEAGLATTSEPLPSLADIATERKRREACEQAAGRDNGGDSARPRTRQKASKRAGFNTTCSTCGRPIPEGTTIVLDDGNWVHSRCGAQSTPAK